MSRKSSKRKKNPLNRVAVADVDNHVRIHHKRQAGTAKRIIIVCMGIEINESDMQMFEGFSHPCFLFQTN